MESKANNPIRSRVSELEDEMRRLKQANRDLSALYLSLLEKSMGSRLGKADVAPHRVDSKLEAMEAFPSVKFKSRAGCFAAATTNAQHMCAQCEKADKQIEILRHTNNDLRLELTEQQLMYEARLESLHTEMAKQKQMAQLISANEPPGTRTPDKLTYTSVESLLYPTMHNRQIRGNLALTAEEHDRLF